MCAHFVRCGYSKRESRDHHNNDRSLDRSTNSAPTMGTLVACLHSRLPSESGPESASGDFPIYVRDPQRLSLVPPKMVDLRAVVHRSARAMYGQVYAMG